MANNPSQLLPSGQFFLSSLIYFSLMSLCLSRKLHYVNCVHNFLLICIVGNTFCRADRQVHRVKNMGDNEGRQGTCWDSSGI